MQIRYNVYLSRNFEPSKHVSSVGYLDKANAGGLLDGGGLRAIAHIGDKVENGVDLWRFAGGENATLMIAVQTSDDQDFGTYDKAYPGGALKVSELAKMGKGQEIFDLPIAGDLKRFTRVFYYVEGEVTCGAIDLQIIKELEW